MSVDASALKSAQDKVLRHYLDQLASSEIEVEEPWSADERQQILQWLQKLSTYFASNISSAITKLASGGSPATSIDWDIAVLTFLESTAMYLRDQQKQNEAVEAHVRGDTDKALQLIRDAFQDINTLATQWGLQFTPLCDLTIARTSAGKWKVSGPYCGAFYSALKPKANAPLLLGIAFKGTNSRDAGQWMADFVTGVKPENNVWGAHVSQGPWAGISNSFKLPDNTEQIAYTQITNGVKSILSKMTPASVPTHVTGHSLGGSYSTLCYARLLFDSQAGNGNVPTQMALSDLYNFGSPRIGYEDFAVHLQDAINNHQGRTWRIVNDNDPIPTVPPSKIVAKGPFIHINGGYHIFPNASPQPIPSEIGTTVSPGEFPLFKKKWIPHMAGAYFISLAYGITGKPLPTNLYPPNWPSLKGMDDA